MEQSKAEKKKKNLKTDFAFQNEDHFHWFQLVSAIPEMQKNCLKETLEILACC